MESRKTALALILIIAFMAGWILRGKGERIEGKKEAYIEIRDLIKTGINNGLPFSIEGWDIKFKPKPEQQLYAGAGYDGPTHIYEGGRR